MIIPYVLNIPHMKFPPFVILEGPDAAGKSTLAHAICHRINGVVFHGASMGDSDQRPANDDIMRRYHTNLLDTIRRNLAFGHAVVCDRLWLSHVVYANARRPGVGILHEDLRLYQEHFLAACASLGAFYIFALDDNCIANVEAHQDKDHPRDMAMMTALLEGYKGVFAGWSSMGVAPCVRYDYTTDGKDIPTWLENLQSHKAVFTR